MKNLYKIIVVWCTCITVFYAQSTPKSQLPKGHQLYKQLKLADKQAKVKKDTVNPFKTKDRAANRIYYELDRTCDPVTRKIPNNIYKKEQAFVKSKKSLAFNKTTLQKSNTDWVNRGPYNVGGRTRALAIDISNEDIILAGGVSGGMWRSEDGGESWRKVTRPFQNPSVTAIAQDPRPGYQHIWYYGGGEQLGSSASSNTPNLYTGVGMYKSQDGGRTWEILTATLDNSVNTVSPFDLINKIKVHPITGDVYVATMNGIHRSQDGGRSFEEVLPAGANHITEILITSSGKLYASVGVNISEFAINPIEGIYTSDNGKDWVNISDKEGVFLKDIFDRSVLAVNPTNDNELYVMSTRSSFVRLYKYNADNSQKWIDLSAQIPALNGFIGGLDTQRGYNMVLEIHPQDPDFIIFGGTNLFRTTDGFVSRVDDTPNNWIGGYSPKNDISLYPDQHPDMHAVVFYPSDPDRVLNANDGGVFRTENIRESRSFEEPVDWESLNNGYLTTQPYAISFDPETESEELLAGFQDNGTWYTDTNNPIIPWEEEFGGDGSFNAFADKGRTRYVSTQFGNIIRINYNEDGDLVSYARAQAPAGGFSFITPFVLDPNDDNIMYVPAFRSLFRNSNMDELPTFTDIDNAPEVSDINWRSIALVPSVKDQFDRELNQITAVGVSKFPVPHKVYYGTGQGQLYRMDFANLTSSEPVAIFKDKGFPARGFISSIEVDPNYSDRVVIAFSNYNVKSVFLTEDGGNTWTDISGNLEENRDGTGNGPSVRWVSFLGNRDGLLAATSTGLYYTNRTLGDHTVWQLESQQIGDGVVMQAKTRKDGFAVLAVHGNGVFSKKFNVTPPAGSQTLFVNESPEDIEFTLDETPKRIKLDLKDVFKNEDVTGSISNASIQIFAENTNTDFIDTRIDADNFLWITFKRLNRPVPDYDREGEAIIRLIGTSDEQKIATEFTVKSLQEPFYDQIKDINSFTIDSKKILTSIQVEEPNATLGKLFAEVADDITVPKGEKWRIDRIRGLIQSSASFGNRGENSDIATLRIYGDDQGKPGALIIERTSQMRVNPQGLVIRGYFDHILSEPIELTEGIYWIVWIKENKSSILNSYGFLSTDIPEGDPRYEEAGANAHFRASFFNVGDPVIWMPVNASIGNDLTTRSNLAFSLFGDVVNNEIENNGKGNTIVADMFRLYPNPTHDSFTIDFVDQISKETFVKVTDMTGKEVYKNNLLHNDTGLIIDTSRWSKGMYLVNVKNENIERTSKITKL